MDFKPCFRALRLEGPVHWIIANLQSCWGKGLLIGRPATRAHMWRTRRLFPTSLYMLRGNKVIQQRKGFFFAQPDSAVTAHMHTQIFPRDQSIVLPCLLLSSSVLCMLSFPSHSEVIRLGGSSCHVIYDFLSCVLSLVGLYVFWLKFAIPETITCVVHFTNYSQLSNSAQI